MRRTDFLTYRTMAPLCPSSMAPIRMLSTPVVCLDTYSFASNYPVFHIPMTPSAVLSQSPPCMMCHCQTPPFIHKARLWPEAAGVGEDWCNLSSQLDTTRMNSSLDGKTGSVWTRVLRSCCLGRNRFGLSLMACLYSSDLSRRCCPCSCRPDVEVYPCPCLWAHPSHFCQSLIDSFQRKHVKLNRKSLETDFIASVLCFLTPFF